MAHALLDNALFLRKIGWSVIPISPESKRPLVKWKPYTREIADEDTVRGWWQRWPRASLAVVTGTVSGLAVVDVDPRHGGDIEAWERAHPAGSVVKTRSGGRHFYYRADEPVRNSVGKLGPGIDVRGESGYVLVPPSKGYEWLTWHALGPMPTLDIPDDPKVEVKEHWIEKLLRGVSYGERNGACARLAGYYLGKHMPTDVVVQQLIAWNRLNDPPLPDREIRQTVESVARTAIDKQAFVSLDDGAADIGSYDVITFDKYLAKYGHQTVSWMVKDWLPAETVGMVVAPPGSYKTWLLQDLAVSVATGLPFLGQYEVGQPGPVLFMQQEDWHGQIAHRFALIATHRAEMRPPTIEGDRLMLTIPPQVRIYLHEHRRFRFDDEQVVQAWVDQIRKIRPRLVVLDPLYSAGAVDDFMAGTAKAMFLFKSIRDQFGTTFLIAHHTRKKERAGGGAGRPVEAGAPNREDVWGSQFLNAWIETGWQVRRREQLGTATILRHFKVQSEAATAVVSFNIDTTQLPTKYDVAVRESKGDDAEEGPDIMRLLEINGTMTVGALQKATNLPRTTLYRRLENLTVAGVIEQSAQGYTLAERLDT